MVFLELPKRLAVDAGVGYVAVDRDNWWEWDYDLELRFRVNDQLFITPSWRQGFQFNSEGYAVSFGNPVDTSSAIIFGNRNRKTSTMTMGIDYTLTNRIGLTFRLRHYNSKISYNSELSKSCKVRLKGDLPQHWSGDKWSLRINTKENRSIEGMTTFSIQDPITRNYTYEWLFLKNLKFEDVLAPNYFFVNVNINGKEKGIYAVEEHFSKEMIERKKRREGIVLSFNEHHMWNLHWNVSWPISYRTSGIEVRNLKRVNTIPQLSKQRDTAVSLLRNFQARLLDAEQVLDHEKTAKFLALSNLWGADHGLSYADINFYYNPITARLEPIAMDAKPEFNPTPPSDYFSQGEMEESWVNYALKSENIAMLYTQYLNKFTSDKYLQSLYEKFGEEEIYYRNLLKKEILLENKHYIWRAEKILLNDPWNIVKDRATAIRRGLDDPNIALFYAYIDRDKKNSNYIKLVARNTLNQPVEIKSFQFNGVEYLAKDIAIDNGRYTKSPLNTSNVILAPNRWLSDTPRNDFFFKILTKKVSKQVS